MDSGTKRPSGVSLAAGWLLIALTISVVWVSAPGTVRAQEPPTPGGSFTPKPNVPRGTATVQSGPNGVTVFIRDARVAGEHAKFNLQYVRQHRQLAVLPHQRPEHRNRALELALVPS